MQINGKAANYIKGVVQNLKKWFIQPYLCILIKITAVFSLLVILYYFFATNAHLSYAQDALEYSFWIENNIITKLNRHLIWSLCFFYIYNFWKMLTPEVTVLQAGQLISAFFGAGGVMLFYLLLKELLHDKQTRILAVVFTGFYAFSFAYWHFSGEIGPQAFSSFLRILLLLCIIRGRKNISKARVFRWGLLFSIVLLSNIMGFYLLPAYILLIYFFSKYQPKLKSSIFTITTLSFFFIFYGFMMLNTLGYDASQIVPSLLYRAPGNPEFIKEFPIAIIYLLLTIVFIPGLKTPSIGNPEIIDFSSIFTPVPTLILLFFMGMLILYFRQKKKLLKKEKVLIYAGLTWFFILFVIQAAREPRSLDNLFHILPSIWLFAFITWNNVLNYSKRKFFIKLSLFLLLSIYVVHNFSGIYLNSKKESSEMYEYYRYIKKVSSPKDRIILISNSGNYELYQIYYLLKNKNNLEHDPMILDGFPYRAYSEKDKFRYNRYKKKLEDFSEGSFLIFIAPRSKNLSRLKREPEVLASFLINTLNNSSPQSKQYKIEIIGKITNNLDKYIVMEDENLNCYLIKLELSNNLTN
jgi:hypothetical protein